MLVLIGVLLIADGIIGFLFSMALMSSLLFNAGVVSFILSFCPVLTGIALIIMSGKLNSVDRKIHDSSMKLMNFIESKMLRR